MTLNPNADKLEARRKAEVLLEALNWIREFRHKLVVIKLGGSSLEDRETVRSLLTDVIFMATVGMRPILIHGGGKAINAAMQREGLEPRWVQGRRYTDEATLDIVARVLAGEICTELVDEINRQGGHALAFSYLTHNSLFAEKLLLDEGGQQIDLGFVGQVTEIDRLSILDACDRGIVPVIPSVGMDHTGQRYNVNADTAAAAVARLLQAEKLVFLSDVPGICRDRKDPQTLLSNLSIADCRALIADGTIDSGMIPKVEASIEALQSGVRKVHMIDGRDPHSLLLEIYSDRGIGTAIVT